MADGSMTYGGGWGYIDPSLQAQAQALQYAQLLAQLQASMAADTGWYYPAGMSINDAYQQIWESMGVDRRANMTKWMPGATDQQKAKRWLEISVEQKVKDSGRDPWRVMEAYGWASNLRQPTLAREKYESALKANPLSMMEYWNYTGGQKGLEGDALKNYVAQNILSAPWVQEFTGQQWKPGTTTTTAVPATTTPATTTPATTPEGGFSDTGTKGAAVGMTPEELAKASADWQASAAGQGVAQSLADARAKAPWAFDRTGAPMGGQMLNQWYNSPTFGGDAATKNLGAVLLGFPGFPTIGQATRGAPVLAGTDWANIPVPSYAQPKTVGMAGGGVINEPISGIGQFSGIPYNFGELGPELISKIDLTKVPAQYQDTVRKWLGQRQATTVPTPAATATPEPTTIMQPTSPTAAALTPVPTATTTTTTPGSVVPGKPVYGQGYVRGVGPTDIGVNVREGYMQNLWNWGQLAPSVQQGIQALVNSTGGYWPDWLAGMYQAGPNWGAAPRTTWGYK